MAKWSSKYIDQLPDSAFLLPNHRKLPYKNHLGNIDLPHVRNALARADQVKGVPKSKVNAAVRRAEKILKKHGGYESNPGRGKFVIQRLGRWAWQVERAGPMGMEHADPYAPAPKTEEAAIQKALDLGADTIFRREKDYSLTEITPEKTMRRNSRRLPRPSRQKPRRKPARPLKASVRGMERSEKGLGDLRRMIHREERHSQPFKTPFRRNPSVELYAHPYDITHSNKGFYFSSPEDYEEKYDANFDKYHIEEYEIQFIDGDPLDARLFDAMEVGQGEIEDFFELVDEDEDTKLALYILMEDFGYPFSEAKQKSDEIIIMEGTALDYVYDLIDDIGISDKMVNMYFDYDSFGRDLRISGDDVNHLEEDLEYEKSMDGDEEHIEYLEEAISSIHRMSDQERGEEFVENMGGLDDMDEETKKRYFDYESFTRDLKLNSEVAEFTIDGRDYVVTNALDI